MPHSLTKRQKQYLEFLREYIAKNESSPKLEELAGHFGVKAPTAHNILKALQTKGYIFFGRSSTSGFFIRLAERVGTAETLIEVAIAGRADKYGEVYDFPKQHGHFPTVLVGADPMKVFAVEVTQHISQANILANDMLLFDWSKKPQPGDICIAPFGKRWFLIRITSTMDKDTPAFVVANQYPVPEKLTNEAVEQRLNWYPLAYDDNSHDYFLQVAKEQDVPLVAIPPDFVAATALRLIRTLAI